MPGRGEDERDYRVAAEMLQALGMPRIRLLTDNPDKARALRRHGIEVVAVHPTDVYLVPANEGDLTAKAVKAGHRIRIDRAHPAERD